MRQTPFSIRAMMTAVALTAVVLALVGLVLQTLHLHDFYIMFGSSR
jgi:hypothetical protein